jgi:hypothetical protein
MFKLLDKAFWRFCSGFVLILVVSFSLLTVFGAFREARENFATLLQSWEGVTSEP